MIWGWSYLGWCLGLGCNCRVSHWVVPCWVMEDQAQFCAWESDSLVCGWLLSLMCVFSQEKVVYGGWNGENTWLFADFLSLFMNHSMRSLTSCCPELFVCLEEVQLRTGQNLSIFPALGMSASFTICLSIVLLDDCTRQPDQEGRYQQWEITCSGWSTVKKRASLTLSRNLLVSDYVRLVIEKVINPGKGVMLMEEAAPYFLWTSQTRRCFLLAFGQREQLFQ